MKSIFTCIAVIFCLCATAADWPQFRGPLGNGVAAVSDAPAKLDANSVAWSVDLPGRGLSSPIIVGDRVFMTCSSGPKQDRLHIVCFNSTDGSKLWERQFWATGRTTCHEKISVAAPSPASDGQRVFALFSSNDLICLDLEGNLQWLRGLMRDYPDASNSLGMSSSLVTADGALVAMIENDGQSITAGLDVKTGMNLWKLNRPKMANWTSPVTIPVPDGRTLIGLQSGKGFVAVEPRTGKSVWEYNDGASTVPSSTLSDGVLFVPSQGITALAIQANGSTPKQLWRSGQLRPSTSSPVVLNKMVFTLNDAGVLTCGDATDGSRKWQLRLKGPYSATPVGAGVNLYCVNEAGLVQVVDTAQPEGAVIGEINLGQTILSTPSIARGALFIRSDGKLWKLGKS
ncbi:MAG: pyrrolo-quinoline quinone [Pedosphaera sp.]|nr:pyrrolo-quinoline quinone [Pedosphaera sp.]